MNENKGQTIFLSVIGIATLLVAIVGATFAWFSATVEGNDEASSITVQAAKIASVIFDDGNTVTMENALPGWSDSKTFTISRPAGATANQGFSATLTYTNTAGAAGSNIQDMYYTLTRQLGSGEVTTISTDVQLNSTSATVPLNSGTFTSSSQEIYTYVITFEFKETGLDQNSQQGASFAGLIQVQVDGGTTVYYNDDNKSGTSTMPTAE